MLLLHSADFQLGKPFARVSQPDNRAALRRQRWETVSRLLEVARPARPELLLVAGDLFDSSVPTRLETTRALEALGQLDLPIFAIPGNHDAGGPGSLWEQEWFQQDAARLAPQLRILLEAKPLELDNLVLLPCPLRHRHEIEDPTRWLHDPQLWASLPPGKPRVVLAHGSVQDFSGTERDEADDESTPAGVPNLLNLSQLPEEEVDYIALGDWHGLRQVGAKAWYSGTPEPDRFPRGASNRPGHALLVEVQRAAAPRVTELATGVCAWHQHSFTFAADEDLEVLTDQIDRLLTPGRPHLLRLELRGHLGLEAATRLDTWLEALDARLLRLKLQSQVRPAPRNAELAALTESGDHPLLARAARNLLVAAGLAAPAGTVDFNEDQPVSESAELARLALRELFARQAG